MDKILRELNLGTLVERFDAQKISTDVAAFSNKTGRLNKQSEQSMASTL